MATGVRIVLSEHADYSLTVSSLVKHTSHLANRFYLAIHYHVSITLSGRNASMSQQLAYDRNVATRSEYHCGKGMSGGMKCNRLVNPAAFIMRCNAPRSQVLFGKWNTFPSACSGGRNIIAVLHKGTATSLRVFIYHSSG